MIQYALKCPDGHTFESWFQSAAAFDKLKGADMVACAVCGRTDVEKAIMAPRVNKGSDTKTKPTPLSAPASPAEQALKQMREHIEKHSDYVGENFAREARAMHTGDAPERSIYGEAKPEEARALIEDGVPVAPLPFNPKQRSN